MRYYPLSMKRGCRNNPADGFRSRNRGQTGAIRQNFLRCQLRLPFPTLCLQSPCLFEIGQTERGVRRGAEGRYRDVNYSKDFLVSLCRHPHKIYKTPQTKTRFAMAECHYSPEFKHSSAVLLFVRTPAKGDTKVFENNLHPDTAFRSTRTPRRRFAPISKRQRSIEAGRVGESETGWWCRYLSVKQT